MRIAVVSSPYLPIPLIKYGGTERVITYLIKGLLEAGHEPILLAPGNSKVDCELIPICEASIDFVKTKAEVPEFQNKVNLALNTTKEKLNEIRSKIDIIHSHGFDLSEFQDFPNLTTLHGFLDFDSINSIKEENKKKLYYASISKNQEGILPDLQYTGVVYNGLNPEEFPIVEKPEDYVCFLGRFDRDKNPHKAIQLAINLGLKIKLAGKIDFKGEDYFKEEIEKYLNHPLVEFLGELNFQEKIKLVSNAKCNFHPINFREPFGLSVLEAAYCGTPTLANIRGSMPELIEDGRTGILVEDFEEGVHQVEKCFAMDRNYIANRAKMLFNYRAMTKQYILAYKKVIDIFENKKYESPDISQYMMDTKSQLTDIWKSITGQN
jgi:glycosyltransferase involved in cell wall biosynthesis